MVTVDEETQAKEFLKRAEIRTMKKDLRALREVDALGERDKIAKIRTLEEQLQEKKQTEAKTLTVPVKPQKNEGDKLRKVLEANEGQERLAEKDLKNYATEEERQKIFLLESQRLTLERQVDTIDKEKDPALKLQKNQLLLQKRNLQEKLNSVLGQEKKLEDEQKFVLETEQTSAISSQKKGLEQSRWDLEKKVQEEEKKRWAIEKEIEEVDNKIAQVDSSSEQNTKEKNQLREKILGADKMLREVYSVVMAREEAKRSGLAEEQAQQKEKLAQTRAIEKENIRREQWTGGAKGLGNINSGAIPVPTRKSNFEDEQKQREKFLKDVEEAANQTK